MFRCNAGAFDAIGEVPEMPPEPEPWVPKVGDRVRVRADGRIGRITPVSRIPGGGIVLQLDGGSTACGFREFHLEPLPDDPVPAAVVVKGLAQVETTKAWLVRDMEAAKRHVRAKGGCVIPGDRCEWGD